MLGNRGITTPFTLTKWAGGRSLQGARTRDLVGVHTQVLMGAHTQVLAGTHGARTRDTAGACTWIQVHTRGNSMSVGIILSKIPIRLQYKNYLAYCSVCKQTK